jgi:hypothetical protein
MVAVTLLVLVAFLGPRAAVGLLLVGALVGAGWMLWRWARRAPAVRAVLSSPKAPVTVELLPPPARIADRSPSTLAALLGALERTQLGAVRSDGRSVILRSGSGDLVELRVEQPDQVVLAGVSVRTNSAELALAACDALAPLLGPMTFRTQGAELLVDGTTPWVTLERTLHDARLRAAMERERSAGPSSLEERRAKGPYLN